MPQLDIQSYPSLIFWLFVSFGLVYFSLRYFILPKLSRVLGHRQEKIMHQEREMKSILEKIDIIEKEIDKKLHNARLESEKLLEAEQEKLQGIFEEKKKEWKELVQKKEKEVRHSLEEEKRKFLLDFKQELPRLSSLVVGKITGDFTKGNI